VIVGFHHYVLQFVAEVLLDGRFVLFSDLGIVCEHADGVEVLAATAFVGRKQLLYGVGGVGAVVKDLGERPMARTNAGERVAQCVCLLHA